MAQSFKNGSTGRTSLAPTVKTASPHNSRKRLLIAAVLLLVAILIIIGLILLVQYLNSDRPIAQTDEEKRIIGTCGGMEIPFDELRFVAMSYRDDFERTYGETVWEDPARCEEFRATVLSVLRNNYAILKACDTYQINYNDPSLADAVQEQIETIREQSGSRNDYIRELHQYYLTDHLLRFTLLTEQAETELFCQLRDFIGKITIGDITYDFYGDFSNPADYAVFYDTYLTTDGKNGKRIPSENMIPVDYLFIQNDAGEDPKNNRALAESYQAQLLAADPADRESLLGQFIGSDKNCAYTGVGPYFIVRGTYTDAFWNGVSGLLEEGDVSPVIEAAGGYYVAVRVAYDEAKLLGQVQTLMKEYQSALVESYIEEIKAGLTVELNEFGQSLDLLKIQMSQ